MNAPGPPAGAFAFCGVHTGGDEARRRNREELIRRILRIERFQSAKYYLAIRDSNIYNPRMTSSRLLPRLATALLAEAMQDSPVVLIHGPRQ